MSYPTPEVTIPLLDLMMETEAYDEHVEENLPGKVEEILDDEDTRKDGTWNDRIMNDEDLLEQAYFLLWKLRNADEKALPPELGFDFCQFKRLLRKATEPVARERIEEELAEQIGKSPSRFFGRAS